jgi:hypothetical protein
MRRINADMLWVPVGAFEKGEERLSTPLVILRRSNKFEEVE